MRLLYTIGLLIGVPLAFIVALVLSVSFEDFMERHFGKPPLVLVIISGAAWVFFFAKMAWEKAGSMLP